MNKEAIRNHDKRSNMVRLFGMVTFLAVAFNAGMIATAMAGYL